MHRKLLLAALLWALCLFPALAQVDQPKDEKAELARKQAEDKRKQDEEKRKQLNQIYELKDDQQKRERLEKYIAENPEGPHLGPAYSLLLSTLLKTDAERALELADRLLANPPGKETRLKLTAYRFKYEALKKLNREEEVKALSRHVLEVETDPSLLEQAAYYDKENASRFYEKAIAERRKGEDKYAYPTVSDLIGAHARLLDRQGDSSKAIERMLEAVGMDELQMRELEKGDDKNKSHLVRSLQQRISGNSVWLAETYVKSKDGKKALEALEKAEQAAGSIPLERRAMFMKLRAEAYEAVGDREKAFETYLRSFAVRMDPKVWNRIEVISRETGRRNQDVMAAVVDLRRRQSVPFHPFELKNLQGETKTFKDLKQKVTLVNFFFPT